MNATTTPEFTFDQLVQINPMFAKPAQRGVVYEVTAPVGYPNRNSTKVNVARLDNPAEVGAGKPQLFIGLDHPSWVGSRDEAALRAAKVVAPELAIGMVVKLKNSKDTKLYVIVGETGGKFRAYALGGSTDGKYLRGLVAGVVTIVPLSELAAQL
jgi:hypothetical protein